MFVVTSGTKRFIGDIGIFFFLFLFQYYSHLPLTCSPGGLKIHEFDIVQPYKLLCLGSRLIHLSFPTDGSS